MLPVLLRADASARIGTGHLMRCLTLATALRRAGAAPRLLVRPDLPALLQRARASGFEIVEVTEAPDPGAAPAPPGATAAPLERMVADALNDAGAKACVVVDGYQFDQAYRAAVRARGATSLVIDDLRPQDVIADVFLDQNFGAGGVAYGNSGGAAMLLGVEFAVLRDEFREAAAVPARRTPARARRLLVSMGGSDPDGMTGRVLDACARLDDPDLQVDVLCGAANAHVAALRARAGSERFALRVLVDPPGVAALMREADLAIAAGGTTSWEMMCVGLPSVKVVLADNQRPVVRALAAAGLCADAGDAGALTPARLAAAIDALAADAEQRRYMADEGRRRVDGRGADRVAAALLARHRARRASATGVG
ncbi:MAG TPA: UDP-2,4-diacetamido-2,4,6-trideoxy-beta-L-altropyranose hydrolase [Myxococcota bacterium]|jgi:UDP-2,4-diacetamido-2,4,6-trideoxy-beta-L-altropyranose hydrolase|nr:UDP-2,4-diacetamido-2,4,6-trideoxy-beta-L-altropyranose hydrolase [Myxococcota bacterium]